MTINIGISRMIVGKREKVIGVERAICGHMWLLLVVGVLLAVACCCISCRSRSEEKASPKEVRVYPPQETVVKCCEALIMGKPEQALSLAGNWPNKDRKIAALRTLSEHKEYLEYTIGPVEIHVNETFDEATLVAVPLLSMTERSRSTGKTKTFREPETKIFPNIVEKRKTADGWQWLVVQDPDTLIRLQAVWLHQPRKKVADSATIVLKKDSAKKGILVQVLSDGEVISERKVPFDE